MFSENEVLLMMLCVLATYVGLTVLWRRLMIATEGSDFYKTNKFEIANADRIFSVSDDSICKGVWCQSVYSLWRCRRTKDFYLSKTHEYNEGKSIQEFSYVDKFRAKDLIKLYAPKELVDRLIADWIEGKNRAI